MRGDRPDGLDAVGRLKLKLGLERDGVGVRVDQSDVACVFFRERSGDIEAECGSFGGWFDSGEPDMANRLRSGSKEKLLDQGMNLIGAN
ncbi:MAG: hypothetical protein ACLQBU_06325 [Terriglobales bacterium]